MYFEFFPFIVLVFSYVAAKSSTLLPIHTHNVCACNSFIKYALVFLTDFSIVSFYYFLIAHMHSLVFFVITRTVYIKFNMKFEFSEEKIGNAIKYIFIYI